MNRLMYDNCAIYDSFRMSTTPLGHVMDINRYENNRECRPEFGVVGGRNSNVATGFANMIDVESNLKGITYPATKCPSYDFHKNDNFISQGVECIKPITHPLIDPRTFTQLNTCTPLYQPPSKNTYNFLPTPANC